MQRPAPSTDYQAALDFLLGRIDYERALNIPYGQRDFRLDRMIELLHRLGNPHHRLPAIHVTGTKGKGSTSAMLAAVLRSAGFRTGLYTSPHLDRLEERFTIDGRQCAPDELVGLVRRVEPATRAIDTDWARQQSGRHGPTYFELLTALAMLHFVDQKVDVAILEVGLGGRLDSTNVCKPVVSVITSISYDHTRQLGNTLSAIAGEKAGIIKPGVPVVSGVLAEEPAQVIADRAKQLGSPLRQLGRDFSFDYEPPEHLDCQPSFGHVSFQHRGYPPGSPLSHIERLSLGLPGEHQAANAAVALATLAELEPLGWKIPQGAIAAGLANVELPARVEVLRRRPTVVLDAAHNVASAGALVQTLGESFQARRKILVFATSRDKDVSGMLAVLLPHFDRVVLTRYQHNPRGMPLEELVPLAGPYSAEIRQAATVAEAWSLAWEEAGEDGLICITGSFFFAAEMRVLLAAEAILS